MRILLTGGAGCLGSNLLEHWIPRGHDVFVLDNFATGSREVLPDVPGLTIQEGSVADAALVEACFERFRPTHVVHSAAAYKDPTNWVEDATTNVLGSIIVAQAARAHGVRRLINFQTALCYGQPSQLPIPVTHPLAPFTSYAISKVAGEAYMLQAGVPTVSLRLANVCAPRLAIGPIPTFYKRLKAGQGCFCSDSIRDFLDVEDFLALVDLAMQDDAPKGVFNVSTGEGRSIKDVFDVVARYLGLTSPEVPIVPVGPDDVPIVVLEPSETERAFGWRARHGFDATIGRQLAWYDRHGVSAVYSHLTSPATS
jgi:nucleoside-diphosphate-sugar epimerase